MKLYLITAFLLAATNGIAQKPFDADTSFSTYTAYQKAVKSYPNIAIVKETHPENVKKDSSIEYCNVNGRKLLLDIFYPANKKSNENIAIIIIHGGGWRSGNRMQHHPLAERLSQLGYTCFTPEYRLSGEAIYPAAVLDVKSAVRFVKENAKLYTVDTSKMVIVGFSAGGALAAFVGNTSSVPKFESSDCHHQSSSTVNAIIDIDGTLSFVHPESSEGDDSKKLSAATQWLGIAKKDSIELWQEASPLTYAGKHTPPTLFINSAVASMHAGRSDYIKVLDQYHIYTEVHSFDNAPHTFCLFDPWFEPTVNYIDQFCKKVFR